MPLNLSNERLLELSKKYRDVRRRVYEEATKPHDGSPSGHMDNKRKLREDIQKICGEADLNRYSGNGSSEGHGIWHHMWSKIRYSGIRGSLASQEIKDIESVFDDYQGFSSPDWDIEIERRMEWNPSKKRNTARFVLVRSGVQVNDFINRTGRFSGAQTVGNLPKLRMTVDLARKFTRHVDEKDANTPALHFVTNGYPTNNVWAIHEHLVKQVGYRGDLTALHCMMDLGFPVMKPDIVISGLFQFWGWLDEILPHPISIDKVRANYTDSKIYKPIIELSQQIAAITNQGDLLNDIGWVTQNPLREFDLFMVIFGQEPDPNYGIIRKLHTDANAPRGGSRSLNHAR